MRTRGSSVRKARADSAEALERRSYVKLSKIEEHLSRYEELMDRQYERLKDRKAFVSLDEL